MNYDLPASVEIGGESYAVRSDYRAILDICAAMSDVELNTQEKAIVALSIFYPDLEKIPSEGMREALERCFWFINCGGQPENRHQLTDGNGSVTGMRSEKGQLIFNASLTLTFSDSSLTGVSGTFLPALDEVRRTDGLDAVDALVHFLDYCSVSGVVCTEVRALDEGYLLQTSSASPLRLQGVWRISTDVSSYYVNCKTGEITRE